MDVMLGIYGQMAFVFHQQMLPEDELKTRMLYMELANQTGNTLEQINAKEQLVKPYYLLGMKDSVLKTLNDIYNLYIGQGLPVLAAGTVLPAIYIHLERQNYQEGKRLLDVFEKESGLVNESGDVARGREVYYYIKGFYYQQTEVQDSAAGDPGDKAEAGHTEGSLKAGRPGSKGRHDLQGSVRCPAAGNRRDRAEPEKSGTGV